MRPAALPRPGLPAPPGPPHLSLLCLYRLQAQLTVGPEGGQLRAPSSELSQLAGVHCIFPRRALTKEITVGLRYSSTHQ